MNPRPLILLAALCEGCALSARYPWDPQPVPPPDSTAEVIRALADVLKAQKLPALLPSPPPAATPAPSPKICLDADGVTAIPCPTPTPEVVR